MSLNVFSQKNRKSLIGINTGMSMDGIDLAHIEISGDFPELKIDFLRGEFVAYTDDFRKRLLFARQGSVSEVAELDFDVAELFSKMILDYFKKFDISRSEIDAIGMHGQILFGDMKPDGKTRLVQVGSASCVAEQTGILTVSNFRTRDISAGGNAAPLVPLLDYVLYRNEARPVAVNNLGSISNVTVVCPDINDVIASDLGPANMPIDFFSEKLFGKLDIDGELSKKGRVNELLLAKMLCNDFFARPLPKAASYSEFGPDFLRPILEKFQAEDPHNMVRTAVEFTARTTFEGYEKFIFPKYPQLKKIRFSGGGVHNTTLMNRFKELFSNYEVESLAEKDKSFSDSKEAIAFALIAHETLCGRPGNIVNATGAKKRVLLGEVALV